MTYSMTYEEVSVILLGATTAACALFQSDQLILQQPRIPPEPIGKTVSIWGGSISVGCSAIQLAVVIECSPSKSRVV